MTAIELYLLFVFIFIIGFVFGVVVGTYPEIFAYSKNRIKRKHKKGFTVTDYHFSCPHCHAILLDPKETENSFQWECPQCHTKISFRKMVTDFHSEDYM